MALNKYATASSIQTTPRPFDYPTIPIYATDGITTTRWSSEFSDNQWFQVDLGQSFSIKRVLLRWEGEAAGKDYDVQVSDNPNGPWTAISQQRGRGPGTQDITGLNGNGRYLRVQGITRFREYGYALYDIEVYSDNSSIPSPTPSVTPSATPGACLTNLALNKTASADSQCAGNEGPAQAVNGSSSDKWCSSGATKFLRLDLGQSYSINRFVIKHAGAGGETTTWNTRDFTIQVSTDGTNWGSAVVTVSVNTASITTHTITATPARYVRLNVSVPTSDGNTAARIYEFEVYGS